MGRAWGEVHQNPQGRRFESFFPDKFSATQGVATSFLRTTPSEWCVADAGFITRQPKPAGIHRPGKDREHSSRQAKASIAPVSRFLSALGYLFKTMPNLVIDLYHGDPIDPSNGFHAMKGAGLKGIVHKATDGLHGVDGEYFSRRGRANNVGLLWGAYHFGQNADGEAQAVHFLDTANPDDKTLVCLDWESPLRGRPAMSVSQAENFVQKVKDSLGRWPVLYSGRSFLVEHHVGLSSPLANCKLWVARYNSVMGKVPSPWTDWVLWQYADSGSEPGVKGAVDVDRFNGSPEELVSKWPF